MIEKVAFLICVNISVKKDDEAVIFMNRFYSCEQQDNHFRSRLDPACRMDATNLDKIVETLNYKLSVAVCSLLLKCTATSQVFLLVSMLDL